MDPAEERRDSKRRQEYMDMVRYVADSEYGIPTACPCGGEIIHEVLGKAEYDTLPGKRFFTCKNYEELSKIVAFKQIETLEVSLLYLVDSLLNKLLTWFLHFLHVQAQVKDLTEQVDNLTVQVQILEKVCFD
ncbi:hypothetical protein Bca101_023305 [Brassica carinata]